ncbi:MAG TPA: amidohydrolase family protein [Longimicrobium sp.]|nr:amidohydrolase family protein [Longimicrobium sp.]
MRNLLACLALLGAGACASAATQGPSAAAASATLAITGVTVVDVAGGPSRPDQTVLIDGSRIVSVAPAGAVRVPAGARVVNGAGKWLIPGLWDMHTHVTDGRSALDLNVANGVTGVRDMGAVRFATARAWRDSIAAGQMLGPRMRIATPVVERADWLEWVRRINPGAHWIAERFGPASPEDAVRWVDSIAALGPDHVKVRNWPDTAISRALVTRAAHHGLRVFAHANEPFPRSGVGSYEHSIFPPLEVSAAARDSLWRRWAASGAAVVPTLVTWGERLQPLDSLIAKIDPARNPMYRYASAAQLQEWRNEYATRVHESPFDWTSAYQAAVDNVREMRAAGVAIMPGSDGGLPTVFPGFGLHDELVALVELAGMTPLEALQAATLRPARFLGLGDSLGTVQAGRLADLVLLDADPLADIRNTRRIQAVFLDGRYLDRAALDALLARTEAMARQ